MTDDELSAWLSAAARALAEYEYEKAMDEVRERSGYPYDPAPLASCGHRRHARGFGCTHAGCDNDSRQFRRTAP